MSDNQVGAVAAASPQNAAGSWNECAVCGTGVSLYCNVFLFLTAKQCFVLSCLLLMTHLVELACDKYQANSCYIYTSRPYLPKFDWLHVPSLCFATLCVNGCCSASGPAAGSLAARLGFRGRSCADMLHATAKSTSSTCWDRWYVKHWFLALRIHKHPSVPCGVRFHQLRGLCQYTWTWKIWFSLQWKSSLLGSMFLYDTFVWGDAFIIILPICSAFAFVLNNQGETIHYSSKIISLVCN